MKRSRTALRASRPLRLRPQHAVRFHRRIVGHRSMMGKPAVSARIDFDHDYAVSLRRSRCAPRAATDIVAEVAGAIAPLTSRGVLETPALDVSCSTGDEAAPPPAFESPYASP